MMTLVFVVLLFLGHFSAYARALGSSNLIYDALTGASVVVTAYYLVSRDPLNLYSRTTYTILFIYTLLSDRLVARTISAHGLGLGTPNALRIASPFYQVLAVMALLNGLNFIKGIYGYLVLNTGYVAYRGQKLTLVRALFEGIFWLLVASSVARPGTVTSILLIMTILIALTLLTTPRYWYKNEDEHEVHKFDAKLKLSSFLSLGFGVLTNAGSLSWILGGFISLLFPLDRYETFTRKQLVTLAIIYPIVALFCYGVFAH